MHEKFKNKYTIKSTRLSGYNYSQNGMYFVTICTKNKEECFGSIVNGQMILNDMGKIVDRFWQEIPKHFPFVNLDVCQIMPNHLHGIIEIIKNDFVETPNSGVSRILIKQEASLTEQDAPVGRLYGGENKNKRGGYNSNWKPNSLGSIINQFKSVCTKQIWKSGVRTFFWQSRYYDRIIRNEIELNRIRKYIFNNPAKWKEDRNLPAGEAGNPENLFM